MVEQVLEHLDILCTVSARDLEQIPEHGPLVIIANHPTGTLDGLALMYAVSRVRRDVKVVTNRMLTHLEPLSSLFIPVDNMGGRTAKRPDADGTASAKRRCADLLPAGEVSRPTRKGIRDKNGTPALLNSPVSCAYRCCRCIFRHTTACSFMPARWCPHRIDALADAADVPPPPQPATDKDRPADSGITGIAQPFHRVRWPSSAVST